MKRYTYIILVFLLAGCAKEKFALDQPVPLFQQYQKTNGLRFEFIASQEILVRWQNLLYRPVDTKYDFVSSEHTFLGMHGLAYNSNDQKYYAANSQDNNLLALNSLTDIENIQRIVQMAGISFDRPHDLVFDDVSGFMYMLDATNGDLFRFKSIGVEEEVLHSPITESCYYRSCALIEGKIYITASSTGQIIEVNDFETGDVTIHSSYGKKHITSTGNYENDGLIPTDIAHSGTYWYLTNYFDNPAADDFNTNNIIRFESFDDLLNGTWTDLSPNIADSLIPYGLTQHNNAIYMTSFPGTVHAWNHTWSYRIRDQE